VAASAALREACHVVLYAARPAEVDPAGLGTALASGRAIYYPRVEGDNLVFCRSTFADLVPGRYGIPEPPARAPRLRPDATGIAILVPGVGFDRSGTRLGTGKGYYDRALPTYPNARRIGLALDACVVDRLPSDPWDVPMQAITTELNLLIVDARVGAYPGDSPWR
jgi:5-formyltetrahydrofolate cyclo-ligase